MNQTFDNKTGSLLEDYWRLNPVAATHAGIHRYDAFLPNWSAAGQALRCTWRVTGRAALEGFDAASLDESQRLDKRVALAEITSQEVEAAWQWANRAPAFYLEEALNGLNYLLARPDENSPLAEREDNLLARLAAVSPLLEQGRANLQPELVPPEYVHIGLVAAEGALEFIAGLGLPDRPQAEDLRRQALQAIEHYQTFIKDELQPGGNFALGEELFERLLRQKHGFEYTPAELYRLGEETTANLQMRLEALAHQIDPHRSWQAIIEDLKADHPSRDTLLQAYAAEADRARTFITDRQLITIPTGESFEVRATSPFLRATTPLGHFDKTPPFDPLDDLGILYITPIDPALPADRQQELLAAHCYTAVRAICLHETFPGHHLQLWCAKLYATPIRKQFASTLYAEGWALYCEELMEETGFFDTPELGLWQLKNSMWRAIRIMIDVGLHCGQLNLESAAQLLVDRAGLEPNTALGEVRRYTTSPTQPSSYMLGRNRIVEMRRNTEKDLGDRFNLREFHDRLMRFSSVSPYFLPASLYA